MRKRNLITSLSLLHLILYSCLAPNNENWTHLRGTQLNGISESKSAPISWSENENISWKTKIIGLGWSSPVVFGDQVWMTTADKQGEWFSAVCLDFETGQVVKEIELFHPDSVQRIHGTNSYASSTPCIENSYVYVHYGTYGTACINTKNFEIVWKRTDMNCEHMQGAASSVILYNDLLIVHLEGTDVQNIYALNKHTGETVWKVGTPDKKMYEALAPVYRKSYQTPIVINSNGEDQLISNRAQYAVSYNPLTGEENWRIFYGEDSPVSMPVFYNGLVLVNSGWVLSEGAPYFARLFAVDPTGKGDVTETNIVWETEKNVPQISSPVIVDSLMFMIAERGDLTCLSPEDGTVYWEQKLKGHFDISPIYAAGNIYLTNTKGKTTIIKATLDFEKVAENQLDGMFKATPAILRGAILQRNDQYLYKIQSAEN